MVWWQTRRSYIAIGPLASSNGWTDQCESRCSNVPSRCHVTPLPSHSLYISILHVSWDILGEKNLHVITVPHPHFVDASTAMLCITGPERRPLLHEHHRKKLSTPHRRAECFRVAAWCTRTNTTTAKAQLMIDVMTSTKAGRVTPV
jgi:hypothetical protein